MFCPSCGKEIQSTDLRFCSACGLKLHGVMTVVEHDGNLPPQSLVDLKSLGLRRKDGLKLSLLIFVVFTFLLTPLTAIISGEAGALGTLVPIFAILGTMLPLALVVVSVLFLPRELQSPPATRLTPQGGALPIKGAATISALPSGNQQPASSYMPPAQGAWKDVEYSTPGSVTEGTTKLLKDEEGE